MGVGQCDRIQHCPIYVSKLGFSYNKGHGRIQNDDDDDNKGKGEKKEIIFKNSEREGRKWKRVCIISSQKQFYCTVKGTEAESIDVFFLIDRR